MKTTTYMNGSSSVFDLFKRYIDQVIFGFRDNEPQAQDLIKIARNTLNVGKNLNSFVNLKRSFDIIGALLFVLCLSPIYIITALAIKLEDRGPIIFSQTRVGKKGRHFKMYKFRSMICDAENLKAKLQDQNESGDILFKIKNDPRVTKVGRIIRKFSIDEFPQFVNVLKGDMSLVGPRPPLPEEVELYSTHDIKRLATKPGITCLWQISGRSDISFAEQVMLDLKYIKEQSIMLDLFILFRTIPAVLNGKGAY